MTARSEPILKAISPAKKKAVPALCLYLLFALCILVDGSAQAQNVNPKDNQIYKTQTRPDSFADADADFYGNAEHEFGFAVGAGFSAAGIGDTRPHDLAIARIYYGRLLGGLKAGDHWYRGRWELAQELFGGGQIYPGSRYLIGETTVLRYNFINRTRWMPFVDAGAGVLATDIGAPDLGSTFEFNEQAGPGIRFFWRKNLALDFQYRFIHISNAGLKEPNQGVNGHLFCAGVSWCF